MFTLVEARSDALDASAVWMEGNDCMFDPDGSVKVGVRRVFASPAARADGPQVQASDMHGKTSGSDGRDVAAWPVVVGMEPAGRVGDPFRPDAVPPGTDLQPSCAVWRLRRGGPCLGPRSFALRVPLGQAAFRVEPHRPCVSHRDLLGTALNTKLSRQSKDKPATSPLFKNGKPPTFCISVTGRINDEEDSIHNGNNSGSIDY